MAAELRKLADPEPPNAKLIKRLEELLEQLLEQAQSGEVQAIVAAVVHRRNATTVWRAGRAHIATLVWALDRAKLRLMGFVEDIDIDLELGGTDR